MHILISLTNTNYVLKFGEILIVQYVKKKIRGLFFLIIMVLKCEFYILNCTGLIQI